VPDLLAARDKLSDAGSRTTSRPRASSSTTVSSSMARVVVAAVAAVLALAAQATGSQAPEWHRSLVGIPLPGAQSTRFHHFVNSTLPREQSILLAFTERDVLASLDPITGALRELPRAGGPCTRLMDVVRQIGGIV
jgi:hypothetical protein